MNDCYRIITNGNHWYLDTLNEQAPPEAGLGIAWETNTATWRPSD